MTARIVRAAFPSYTGRTVKLDTCETINVSSYWSGGSRDFFAFVNLADMATIPVPQQSAFDPRIPGAESVPIPNGVVCVEHSIFCGKDLGITIHANPATLAPLLPAPEALLTWEQRVVLYATRCLKSSYGGVKNLRQHEACKETKITPVEYDAAKTALIASGHLNGAGAITPKGRNACQGHSWPKREV